MLHIVFDQYLLNSGESQDTDRPGGLDLVGWDEWLSELKDQKLALRVGEHTQGVMDNAFEFVPVDQEAIWPIRESQCGSKTAQSSMDPLIERFIADRVRPEYREVAESFVALVGRVAPELKSRMRGGTESEAYAARAVRSSTLRTSICSTELRRMTRRSFSTRSTRETVSKVMPR